MNKKRENFVKLVNKRVNNALKKISLVGNLANKNNYEYSENDVNQIFKALENEIKDCKSKFDDQSKKQNKFNI